MNPHEKDRLKKIYLALGEMLAAESDRQPADVEGIDREMVAPFGRTRGTPLRDLSARDLAYFRDAAVAAIDDPARKKFAAENQRLARACEYWLSRVEDDR